MADLLKELAEVLGIREVKKESSYVPKKRDSIGGSPRVPKYERNVPIKPVPPYEPVPLIGRDEGLEHTIAMNKKLNYLRPKEKPVTPLKLDDWRRGK